MKERLTERDRYWKDEELWTSAQEPTVEEIDEIYYRLAEYEDKIENGTLVELPCAVGDMAYRIWNEERVIPVRVIRITFAKETIFETTFGNFLVEEIGKKLFLTKAKAEKKLKELKEE